MATFEKTLITEYAVSVGSEELPVLAALDRETHLKVLNPRMLSGHLQGNLLQMISKMIQPSYILEIGTYTGYSAICLAQGLADKGKLITIDINEELEEMVHRYIKIAALEDKIDMHLGHALDIIPTLDYVFDLVFIDADKENYANYYQLVIDKVRPGGYIIADNVLWDGKVLHPEKHTDAETVGIIEFNNLIKADKRVEKVLLPIRDGLFVIRKC